MGNIYQFSVDVDDAEGKTKSIYQWCGGEKQQGGERIKIGALVKGTLE